MGIRAQSQSCTPRNAGQGQCGYVGSRVIARRGDAAGRDVSSEFETAFPAASPPTKMAARSSPRLGGVSGTGHRTGRRRPRGRGLGAGKMRAQGQAAGAGSRVQTEGLVPQPRPYQIWFLLLKPPSRGRFWRGRRTGRRRPRGQGRPSSHSDGSRLGRCLVQQAGRRHSSVTSHRP